MKKVILLYIISIFACTTQNSIPFYTGDTRSFQFNYVVDIESTDGEKLELWLPIPKSSEVQAISNLKINTNGLQYSIEEEKIHGNQYLYINDTTGTTKVTNILMTFEVMRKEHQNIMYNNVDPKQYLGSYSMVPIGGMFKKVITDNNLSKNDIRGIYDYVFEGMHYGKPKSVNDKYYKNPWLSPNEKYGTKQVGRENVVNLYQKSTKDGSNYTFGHGNAVYACDIGVGNCTDYHSYFMSLDRTLGIPARFHMGFLVPSKKEGEIDGYHCWADYYVDNEGWFPVDISEADKDPKMKDYYFGSLDNNRVAMMIGRDIILKGYESEVANFLIYPIMEINDKESSAFSKSFSYKNLLH